MSNKVNRALLKKAIRLSVAINTVDFFEGCAPHDLGLTHKQYEVLSQEARKLAYRLAGNHPMNMGSGGAVIDYFRELNSKNE